MNLNLIDLLNLTFNFVFSFLSNRQRLSANLHSCLEDQSTLLECLGTEGSLTGQVSTADDLDKLINSITLQDVTSLVNKVVKGKPAIAAIGHLDNMPYSEDIMN